MCREDGRCLQAMTLIAACNASFPAMVAAGSGEVLDVALRFSNDEEQWVPTNASCLE